MICWRLLVIFLAASGMFAASGADKKLPRTLIFQERATDTLAEIPSSEVPCPVCDWKVLVAKPEALVLLAPRQKTAAWRLTSPDYDIDLCPHPTPNRLNFEAGLPFCPYCGFCAPVEDFTGKQPETVRGWAADRLSPNTLAAERALTGEEGGRLSRTELAGRFRDPAAIPDVLRLEHALAYAEARRQPALVRADLNQRAAWANRRALVALAKTPLLAGPRAQVEEKLRRDGAAGDDLAPRIDKLAKLSTAADAKGKKSLDPAESLAAQFMLAAGYARLGYGVWAEQCLENVRGMVRQRFTPPSSDPLWKFLDKVDKTKASQALDERRAALEEIAVTGLSFLAMEREKLTRSSDLRRVALRAGDVPEADIAGTLFMIGEAYRRAGRLDSADAWLAAAAHVARDQEAPEGFAERQRDNLRGYAAALDRKVRQPGEGELAEMQSALSKVRR